MNFTGNKLYFKTLKIYFTLSYMQSVDYTKFCFTPVDSMNIEDQRTRPISYGKVKRKELRWTDVFMFRFDQNLFEDSVQQGCGWQTARRRTTKYGRWKNKIEALEVNLEQEYEHFRNFLNFPSVERVM